MPRTVRQAAALLLIVSSVQLTATVNARAQATPPNRTAKPVNCALKPSRCGYPDATNTGVPAGTKLTVVNGHLSITKAGTVIDGKDIRGCVLVKAPNVTIRRSKVTCTGHYAIGSFVEEYKGGGLLIEDVEVDCRDHHTTGVGSYGMTARRLDIHGCENGFDTDDTTSVLDSYIHDLYEGATGHADGIQLAGGSNIRIRHNTIFAPGGTAAIISHPTKNANVLVENNFLAGGAYTLYCPRRSSSDYRVVGNRFGRQFSVKGGAYGAWTDCRKVSVVRDNFWDNNLKPL
ncbi:hypothetical protein [Nonomuraea sp. NPDC050643]|uniref:hypothetical protein n=1 Tax=Nonomuraea sp. NPDC050643 TaxID=3155660 RepID=UPI003407D5EC